jgi:hypothetical protein
MAIDDNVGMWHETATTVYNAREYRRLLYDLLGYDIAQTPGIGAGGIFKANSLKVQERGTPNNSVDVLAGGCVVRGTQNSNQGAYFVYNDATVNVPMSVGNATNPRKDVIGVQVTDVEYGGASHSAAIAVLTGTPAGSPVEPTRPANWLDLALVDVPANDTVFNNAQITDRRRLLPTAGGVIICTSTTRPTLNLYKGMTIYETDTNRLMEYQTATTLWTPPWNMPWGVVTGGYASRADSVTSGAMLQISPSMLASRRYRFTFWGMLNNGTGSTQYPVVAISDFLGNNRCEWWPGGTTAGMANGQFVPQGGEFVWSNTAAGSLPWNLSCSNGVRFGANSANEIAWFSCEDIGPSGAPA